MGEVSKAQRATKSFIRSIRKAKFQLPELEQEFRFLVVSDRLEQFNGHQVRTAESLGIHRNSLGRILEEMERAGRQFTAQRKAHRKPPAPSPAPAPPDDRIYRIYLKGECS